MDKIGSQSGVANNQIATLGAFLPTNSKEINEEQLFIAIVSQQLEKKKPGLGKQFHTSVQQEITTAAKNKGRSPQLEDVGQKALLQLEQKGLISKSDREKIVKTAWTAAQLDDKAELWDSRGGKEDPTIAKTSRSEAESKAQKNLEAIQSGSLKLIDPKTSSNSSGTVTGNKGSKSVTEGPAGFLWKPVSNNSGTAALLFDAEMAKNTQSVSIVGPDGKEIAQGRFTSFGDDGKRGKYEFPKAGNAYPSGSSVVITLKSGEKITVPLGDPAKRLENK